MSRLGVRRAAWVLRGGFAAMCAGQTLRWLRDDGPVFELLRYDWGLDEALANRIDDAGYALLAIAGVLVLTRGHRLALAWIVLWQSICTIVATARDAYWPAVVPLSDATRWFAPAVLAWWLGRNAAGFGSRGERALWWLRIAAAATFVGHGLTALALRGEFLDFLLIAHVRATGTPWDQATAEVVLRAIGAADLVAAGLLLATRWRCVAAWMAAWGAIAAGARIVHSGLDSYSETLLRTPNALVPLAILVAWSDRGDSAGPSTGEPDGAGATA